MKNNTKMLAQAGIIAALYVILTMISTAIGLSSGFIQLRLSEALCILAIYTPAAIPGLAIGCIIGNILSGLAVFDVIFGSLATLVGAIGSWVLRRRKIAPIAAPIIANTVIIPPVIIAEYGLNHGLHLVALSIFISETISVVLLGHLVEKTYKKIQDR